MRKSLFLVIVIAFSLMVLAPGPAMAEKKPMVIKFAHQSPPKPFESPLHAASVAFKYLLEKRSGGKLQVEIYPSGTLGKEVDVMEALNNNVVQVSLASAAGFHRIFPPAMILFTPYIFRNADIAMEVIEGPFGKKLMAAFAEKTGMHVLNIAGSYTYMAITNNKKPIKKPADMKGMKFRVMDPLGGMMFKAFGASAVPISWAEVYTSLQTGVVDGQTNPATIVAWAKLNEVQKYMTLANSQWGYQLLICNKQWYDSLTDQDRIMVRDAVNAAKYAGNGLSLMLENVAANTLKEKGMEVTMLSDAEIKEFEKVARPVCMKWVREQLGAEWADELTAAIDAAEKKLGYK